MVLLLVRLILALSMPLASCLACLPSTMGMAVEQSPPAYRENAAWLGIEWVNEPVQQSKVLTLSSHLRKHRIRTVYVYTSYMRGDGTFGQTYAHATRLVQHLKDASPELSVQAWIGLPLELPVHGLWAGTVDLADADTRSRIVALGAHFVEDVGFDGVHLDPEPVMSGNRHLLCLLAELRQALGVGPTISIAGRRIAPFPGFGAEKITSPLAWSSHYYRQVAAHVDEVALMTYDSALPWPWAYRAWTCLETIRVSRALATSGVNLYIGVPTSEEKTATHYPAAENISSGIEGVLIALEVCQPCKRVVTGLAIYPYWETEDQEWEIYQELWLSK